MHLGHTRPRQPNQHPFSLFIPLRRKIGLKLLSLAIEICIQLVIVAIHILTETDTLQADGLELGSTARVLIAWLACRRVFWRWHLGEFGFEVEMAWGFLFFFDLFALDQKGELLLF